MGGAGAIVSKNTNATAEEKHGFPDGVTWPPTAAWRPTAPQRVPPGVAGPSDSRPGGLDVRLAPDVRVRAVCVRAHRAGPAGHAPSPRGPARRLGRHSGAAGPDLAPQRPSVRAVTLRSSSSFYWSKKVEFIRST